MRRATGVTLKGWRLRTASPDDRPAFVFDAADAKIQESAAARGPASAYDVGLRNGAAVRVADSTLVAFDEGAHETPKHMRVPRGSNLTLPPYYYSS